MNNTKEGKKKSLNDMKEKRSRDSRSQNRDSNGKRKDLNNSKNSKKERFRQRRRENDKSS